MTNSDPRFSADIVERMENFIPGEHDEFTPGVLRLACAEIRRLRTAAQSVVVPDGWKLVPLIPTERMIEVGCDNNPTQWNEGTDHGFPADVASDIYVSMVRAAQPPAAPVNPPAHVDHWSTTAEAQGVQPPAAPVDLTNHHNALKCPYCNPKGLQFAEPHEGCSADTARVIFPEEDWPQRDCDLADWFNGLTGKPSEDDWISLMAVLSIVEPQTPSVREAVIEECARACEARIRGKDGLEGGNDWGHNAPYNAEDKACAAAIRDLALSRPLSRTGEA